LTSHYTVHDHNNVAALLTSGGKSIANDANNCNCLSPEKTRSGQFKRACIDHRLKLITARASLLKCRLFSCPLSASLEKHTDTIIAQAMCTAAIKKTVLEYRRSSDVTTRSPCCGAVWLLCVKWAVGKILFPFMVVGPVPWGYSGPLCHALSLSLSSSMLWTSVRRRRATVPLETSGELA